MYFGIRGLVQLDDLIFISLPVPLRPQSRPVESKSPIGSRVTGELVERKVFVVAMQPDWGADGWRGGRRRRVLRVFSRSHRDAVSHFTCFPDLIMIDARKAWASRAGACFSREDSRPHSAPYFAP